MTGTSRSHLLRLAGPGSAALVKAADKPHVWRGLLRSDLATNGSIIRGTSGLHAFFG